MNMKERKFGAGFLVEERLRRLLLAFTSLPNLYKIELLYHFTDTRPHLDNR